MDEAEEAEAEAEEEEDDDEEDEEEAEAEEHVHRKTGNSIALEPIDFVHTKRSDAMEVVLDANARRGRRH